MTLPQTRELRLVDGSTVTVDDQDFWKFMKTPLYSYRDGTVYFRADGRTYRLHREILGVRDRRVVIYLDGNPRNCTRVNLAIRDRGMYGRQRPSRGASGYKGVSPYRGRWQATIRVDGRLKWLGTFDDAVEAAEAYDDAVIRYRGRVGVLNFPNRRRRRKADDEPAESE
jgi:hypothetical protein